MSSDRPSNQSRDLAKDLRTWADHPASSGYVPMHPNTLREVADLIDSLRDPPIKTGSRCLRCGAGPEWQT